MFDVSEMCQLSSLPQTQTQKRNTTDLFQIIKLIHNSFII